MPRVLHVCPYLHPLAGGPAALVPVYSDLLTQYGWQASMLTTDWYSPGGCQEIIDLYKHVNNITVLHTGNYRWLTLLRDRQQSARPALEQAELIHIHGHWHPLGWMSMEYSISKGIPYVISSHGMLDPYSFNQGKIKKSVYFRLVEKKIIQNAARVVFTTEKERERALPLLDSSAKSEVVLLGADDPPGIETEDLKKRFLMKHPELKNKKIILFMGRLHPKKNPGIVVQLMPDIIQRVPDTVLLMVGDGVRDDVIRLRRTVEKLKLNDKVYFTGFLTSEEKWAAMSVADVFVLPSEQENFAIAVAEAMKINIPVIISNNVNIWPLVEQAGAGIVLQVDDNNSWVKQISELLVDTTRQKNMGMRAGELAKQEFSWQVSTEHLADIYNNVLSEAVH